MPRGALLFSAATVALSVILLATESYADRLKFYPPSELQKLCHTNNGTFLPPTADQPAYGCLKGDVIIVCGGPRKWAKRCDAYSILANRGVRKHMQGGGLLSR